MIKKNGSNDYLTFTNFNCKSFTNLINDLIYTITFKFK
jgi:hypothetical protein